MWIPRIFKRACWRRERQRESNSCDELSAWLYYSRSVSKPSILSTPAYRHHDSRKEFETVAWSRLTNTSAPLTVTMTTEAFSVCYLVLVSGMAMFVGLLLVSFTKEVIHRFCEMPSVMSSIKYTTHELTDIYINFIRIQTWSTAIQLVSSLTAVTSRFSSLRS